MSLNGKSRGETARVKLFMFRRSYSLYNSICGFGIRNGIDYGLCTSVIESVVRRGIKRAILAGLNETGS